MDLLAGPGVVVALLAAVCSAATFGLSTSLQHRAVGSTAPVRMGRLPRHLRLMAGLLMRPSWVLGMSLSVVALALHAVALDLGSLILVQPVIVTGIVFAVLCREVLDRRWPAPSEVGWALVTWAGLAAFLTGSDAGAVSPTHPPHLAGAVVAVLLVAAAAALGGATRATNPVARGLWLGAVSGVLFGVVASLMKLVLSAVPGDLGSVFTHWPLWALVACGGSAVLVNQRAYDTTRLSVSMPLLNIVDAAVALLFAAVVLGETPATTPVGLTLSGAGLIAMVVGVVRLSKRVENGATRGGAPLTPAPELVGSSPSRRSS